jgi:hypothetical protein
MQLTSTPSYRWEVPRWAWLPIITAIIAASVSNALRAYELGTHLDAFTLTAYGYTVSISGVVLVFAAVAVSAAQPRAAWVAFMVKGWSAQRVFAIPTVALLVFVSATSIATHLLEAERNKTGDEQGQSGDYSRDEATYNAAKAKLDRYAEMEKEGTKTRTTTEVRQAMDNARVPPSTWRNTKQCTDTELLKGKLNYEACKPILDLREENGRAIDKARQEQILAEASVALAGKPKIVEASEAETFISKKWAWAMAAAIVFLETFGTMIWARRVEIEPVQLPKVSVGTPRVSTVSEDQKPVAGKVSEHLITGQHAEVFKALYRIGRPATNNELAETMGVCKGEASKRVDEMNGMLSKVKLGREVAIWFTPPPLETVQAQH